jgi:hypothetical protein
MTTMYPIEPTPNRARVESDIKTRRGERASATRLESLKIRRNDPKESMQEGDKLLELGDYLDQLAEKAPRRYKKLVKKRKKAAEKPEKKENAWLLVGGGILALVSALYDYHPGWIIGTVMGVFGFFRLAQMDSTVRSWQREQKSSKKPDVLESLAKSKGKEEEEPSRLYQWVIGTGGILFFVSILMSFHIGIVIGAFIVLLAFINHQDD